MHHSLKIYSRYRESFLRYYIFQAKWTRIPVAGNWVRWVANKFGRNVEGAYLITGEEACAIIDSSAQVALGPCACRQTFRNCNNPVDTEIMVGLHQNIFVETRPQSYRAISKEEAKEVIKDCHQRGLVHTIIRCGHDFYAICNCCSCCCVPLRLSQQYGIGNALTRSPDIVGEFKEQLVHGS